MIWSVKEKSVKSASVGVPSPKYPTVIKIIFVINCKNLHEYNKLYLLHELFWENCDAGVWKMENEPRLKTIWTDVWNDTILVVGKDLLQSAIRWKGKMLTVCCGDSCRVPIHQVISGGGYPPVAWHVTILDFPSLT